MQIIFKKPLGRGSALSTCHFPDTILGKICEHYWTIFTQDKSIKTWKKIIFQYLSEHRWRNKKSERSKEKRRNLAQGNYLPKLLSLILELCNSRPKLVKQSSISKIHHQPDINTASPTEEMYKEGVIEAVPDVITNEGENIGHLDETILNELQCLIDKCNLN